MAFDCLMYVSELYFKIYHSPNFETFPKTTPIYGKDHQQNLL
jgi:hypothetical protein